MSCFLSYTHIHVFRLSTDSITEIFTVEPDAESLNHLQWHLKWGRGNDQRSSVLLMLQCVPVPDFANKLDSVKILVGLNLFSSDESMENESLVACIPALKTVVRLTKQVNYQCTLLHDSRMMMSSTSISKQVSLTKFDANITYI